MITKIFAVLLIQFFILFSELSVAHEKWKALDETVIEKIAQERGKEPRALFELEGDLELFLFTLIAGISGFVVGYFWRKLLDERENSYREEKTLYQPDGAKRKG